MKGGKELLRQLDKRCDEGLIRKSQHKTLPLTIYSYTQFCQWKGNWDQFTLAARGLILDNNGAIVAKPFSKFFNYGEPHCPDLPGENLPYEIFEKIDGSLGIYYNYEGTWHVATRGSFDNEFVDYGRQFLPYMDGYHKHHTICTEICMPKNLDGLARAVEHEPGLYFLGAIDLYSGNDMANGWGWMAKEWPGKLPRRFTGSVESLADLARSQEDTEGWVICWHNGFRVKIKTAWYSKLFRAISRIENTVRSGMLQGLKKKEILKDVPEELHAEAARIYDELHLHVLAQESRLFNEALDYWNADRRTFALSIQNHPDKSFLFSIYDNQDISTRLIEECKITDPDAAEVF